MFWPFKKKKKTDFFDKLVVKKKSLGKPCKEVVTPRQADKAELIAQELVGACKVFSKEHPQGCVGLAANQLGYNLRVICVKRGSTWVTYINPHFTAAATKGNRKQLKIEGCLSHPDKPFKVERYRKIWAWGDNREGKLLTGLEAEAFQHEMDHLNGVLV